MLDRFPIPYSQKLAEWSIDWSNKAGLYAMPLHIHEVLFCFLFYTATQLYLSPAISRRLFPKTYADLKPKTRINWDIHVVAFVQSIFVCAASLYVILYDEERKQLGGGSGVTGFAKTEFGTDAEKGVLDYGYWERVFGYTGGSGFAQAAGCGYFLWDIMVSLRYMSMFGPGMVAHAVSAFAVFTMGLRPFLIYYAPIFALYELSSPFLNIHWYCDKLGLTGSTFQLINGILLLATFFSARLIYGTYQSIAFLYDVYRCYKHGPPLMASIRAGPLPTVGATAVWETNAASEIYKFIDPRTKVPVGMAIAYLISNTTLNALNWYWMGKMVDTIRRRFPPPFGTMKVGPKKGQLEQPGTVDVKVPRDGSMTTGVARGVYADGHRSVEVEGLQVRQRPDVKRGESEQVFVP